jgi:hypothetical protein
MGYTRKKLKRYNKHKSLKGGNNLKFAVMGIFKNEEIVIREWIEHYQWQGVDEILLLNNGSTDNWKDKIHGLNHVTIIDAPKQGVQNENYNTIGMPWLKENKVDVVAILDLDEFMFGTDGKKLKEHVIKIFSAPNRPSKFVCNWTMFGSSGLNNQPESIRKSFTWKKRNINDNENNVKGVIWLNDILDNGIDLHNSKVSGRTDKCPSGIQLNHYAIQSKEYFEKVKMSRGNATRPNNPRNWNYFKAYNHRNQENTQLKQLTESNIHSKKHGGNKFLIPIIIYSHSDVFDVLKIQLEYFTKLFSNTQQDIYLLSNIPYTDSNIKYTTILYNDKDPYFTRLLSCINQINSEHFIITHESDILINFDKDVIEKLVNVMKEKKIDSINLQHIDGNTPEIKVSETLYISKMKGLNYIFCVQPRIWNRESAIKLFSSLPNKSYKSSENVNTQKYMQTNQNTYITHSTNKIILPGNVLKTIPEYYYIHITRNGKFMMCKKYDDVNPNIQTDFDRICNVYIKNSERSQTI